MAKELLLRDGENGRGTAGEKPKKFPVLGIVLMCLICVFMGAPMQLVRKLSGSVIPAIVFHGIVDSVMNFLLGLFLTTEYIEGHAFALGVVGLVIPTVILGIPAWILLHKK